MLDRFAVQRRTGGLRDVVTKRYLPGRIMALSRRRRSPRVVIIGAGFGGLAAAVALRRRGIDDLMIIERADGVGGTWRRNIYPGAACDIQSHLYSFSFAPEPGLEPHLRLSAGDPRLSGDGGRRLRPPRTPDAAHVSARIEWNAEASNWDVNLTDGGAVIADVVVSAVGLFGAIRYPDIDGLADFSGRSCTPRSGTPRST